MPRSGRTACSGSASRTSPSRASLVQALTDKAVLPANMFSLSLEPAMITFGGYRADQLAGPLHWVATVEDSGYWEVGVSVSAGGAALDGTKAVLDTGSSVIAAPASAVATLKAIDCAHAPDLDFEVDGARLRVPAKAYRPSCDELLLVPLQQAATDETADVLADAWVLGDPFLRHYLTVFDIDGRRVGFAKPKRSAGLLAKGRAAVRKSDGLLTIPLQRRARR